MVDNILKIQELLVKYKIKTWVLVDKEGRNNVYSKYVLPGLHSWSMCFISENKVFILVHDLEIDNIDVESLKESNIFIMNYAGYNQFIQRVEDVISELNFVNNISLSYSTINDSDVDIMGHGEYITYTEMFKMIYDKYKKNIRFTSSEHIVYELLSAKTEVQIERIKFVCKITTEILIESFKTMRVGMNEIQIAKHIRDTTKEIGNIYLNSDVTAISLAWEDCPIVLTGDNMIKGGHTIPGERVLQRGDTVYVDFGICVTFSDEEKIYSDLQRMGYVLKLEEIKAPKEVQHVFDTLYNSIELSLDYMKPGVKAYDIDNIVRSEVLRHGYPNYNHSTGHPVGLKVHDVGAIIAGRTSKRANLELVENGVYTLEPRIAIINGGSIEEMFQVTKFGAIPMSERQKEIYLIN